MRRKLGLVVLSGCLVVGLANIALSANNPRADDFQGNFTVEDPNYPPQPVTCGVNWKELRNRTYTGTIISSTTPELNNKKMVLLLSYLGGAAGGSGVALGTVSIYAQGAVSDVLVARGPFSAATNGYVPPENIANGNGYMELTFYDRGQPTPRRTIALVGFSIGSNIQGAIGGSVTGKSVVWNGEMCP